MTCSKLAIFCLLPLAFGLGCEDSNPPGNGGNDADADTDSDSDSDTDADSDFEATIVATIPFEGVQVTVDDVDADCVGTSCTFSVTEAGDYTVEAWDTYTFIPKEVNVDKAGQFSVEWTEVGCASDSSWDATGPCDEWTPGEYGMVIFEGERDCVDEIWGREAEIEFVVTDEAITIKGISSSYESTMSGNNFYWSHSSGGWAAGIITDDGGLHVYQLNMVNGGIDEFLFYCD